MQRNEALRKSAFGLGLCGRGVGASASLDLAGGGSAAATLS